VIHAYALHSAFYPFPFPLAPHSPAAPIDFSAFQRIVAIHTKRSDPLLDAARAGNAPHRRGHLDELRTKFLFQSLDFVRRVREDAIKSPASTGNSSDEPGTTDMESESGRQMDEIAAVLWAIQPLSPGKPIFLDEASLFSAARRLYRPEAQQFTKTKATKADVLGLLKFLLLLRDYGTRHATPCSCPREPGGARTLTEAFS
jgi:hypothetical protein